MNSFWHYLIHLAAFAGGVTVLTILKRRNAPWAVRAVTASIMSMVMAVFIFRISEPPQLFADFYKAYYPAAKALFAANPNDGLSATMREGAGGFVNLPVLAWLFAPFGKLPTPAAGYAFMTLGVAAIVATWYLLTRLAGLDRDRALLLLFVFACFGPLHNSLREGNTTHFVLLLIVSGLWALRRERGFLAGLLIGFAALVKLPLLLLGVYFAAHGRWRVAMGGATVCVIAAILSIALFGWDLHVYWYENSIKPFAKTPMAAFNVQSVQGFLARLDHGGRYLLDWTPHAVNPMVHLASQLAVALMMLSAAFVMFRPRRWRRGPLLEAPASTVIELEVCIVTLLAMMISMVSWSHYFLWMLLPAAFLIAGNPSALAAGRLRIFSLVALILAMPPVLKVFTIDPILSRVYCYLAVSHYLIGAALLFVVLLVADWRTRPVGSEPTE
ncbi:MAG: hypothetical protein RLZZ214_4025 [Verrucomicrobiota bacterium]|jgi:hypothetical protein